MDHTSRFRDEDRSYHSEQRLIEVTKARTVSHARVSTKEEILKFSQEPFILLNNVLVTSVTHFRKKTGHYLFNNCLGDSDLVHAS